MIQLLEESKEDLVAFRISVDVDKSDYEVMLPLLEERIKQHGKIRVYAEIYDVKAFTLAALWEEIKFDFTHAADFTRVAIVGDQTWTDVISVLAKPFTTAEVKHYDFNQRQQAWEWINS
ncbi:STAS/SEC14 domain-containing protein [Pontibacter locisalis]|uniref:STAS/SEC14 domain-containing protein n=1 Tax=Pontibacter locisalis TaxID=1719035 RepID=A0ABW5II60_9BACT